MSWSQSTPRRVFGGSNAYKGRDGTRYEILTANTREEAERVARGKNLVVLEVVPRWTFPARYWGRRQSQALESYVKVVEGVFIPFTKGKHV